MKELMLGIFIVSAPMNAQANQEQDAYRAAAEASYKQSGLEEMINKYTEKELRRVPKPVRDVVGNAYIIGKTIQERRIVYIWSF